MTKLKNNNLTSNNLEFLNSLSKDEYPSLILFREHLKEHTPLQLISEFVNLEVAVHNMRSKDQIIKCLSSLWLIKSSIVLILKYGHTTYGPQNLKDLEKSLNSRGEGAFNNAQTLMDLINDSIRDGFPVEGFKAVFSMISLLLKMGEQNIQNLKISKVA